MSDRLRTTIGWWPSLGRAGVVATGLLASLGISCQGHGAEPGSYRSVKDVRPRIPDELDRPVRRETSSHRGWEIREDQFTIAANTSLADARWAAAEVAKVRGETAALADRFTQVHRNPDFGLNSLQVVIDGQPSRDRDAPAVTINVIGIQTQATINVSSGQPDLKQQLLRLREAAALAMLHAAELDSELPPWVVGGIASHVARQGQEADSVPEPNDFAPRNEPLGGQQWRQARAAQDRLDLPQVDRTAAASQVSFLLSGNDGQHAPEFLTAIAEAIEVGRARAATTAVTRRRGELPTPTLDQTDRFGRMLADIRPQYEAWLKDPQAGQPVYEPAGGTAPELDVAQREMLVLLKLGRLLAREQSAVTSVKVVTFDREKGRQQIGLSAEPAPLSPAAIAGRLRDPSRPAIATLDVDGRLLLSTDRERINRLLGWDGQRYQLERHEDKWLLATRLADGRALRGHLADNPAVPSRPIAKFTVEGLASSGVKSQPAANARDAAANVR